MLPVYEGMTDSREQEECAVWVTLVHMKGKYVPEGYTPTFSDAVVCPPELPGV